MKRVISISLLILMISISSPVFAQDDADLAQKLANPVAALISVPIQANYDKNIGPNEDGSMWKVNIQPIIPFALNQDWNLISRTILPLVDQNDIPLSGMGETGIGDTVQSFFVSPVEPTAGGAIWGAGVVLQLPTATDSALGSEKWGIGPSAVVLKQGGSWTYGFLANHIESIAGDDDRDDVSATLIQPFLSYITKTKTTISLNAESVYDWESDQLSLPATLMVSQMLKFGSQIVQLGGGVKYWVDSPDNGPDDWGLRLQLTFLFPK